MPGVRGMLICNFTGAYEGQTFYEDEPHRWLDLSDIEGTNCYLDEAAKPAIRQRLESAGAFRTPDIHFLDSGNYHYMTIFFLAAAEEAGEDFALLVFDNHPDMKAAAFGDITSCGGWILEAAERFTHLRQICLVGVDEELLTELQPLPESVSTKLVQPDGLTGGLPLYISIDKDVMPEPYTYCQWSQGSMRPEEIDAIVSHAAEKAPQILGIDICGESEETCNEEHRAANDRTNRWLLKSKALDGIFRTGQEKS